MLPLPTKVMIVEDELVAQRHLKNILQSLGVELAGAYDNAADARAALTRECCEMILMDINIKGPEDGIQLTRSILQQYNIPVVFISAYSDGETLSEVMELSPYGFVTKPFSAKDIEVAMGVAFSRYHVDKHKNTPPESADTAAKPANGFATEGADTVTIGETYRFDLITQTLYQNDTMVRLNKKQRQLIEILARHANQIVDYGSIMDEVWPEGVAAESSLRTLVYSVRKLMPDFPIESHSKMGYALKDVTV
jgi:DNA-binding response OmpR family regulator